MQGARPEQTLPEEDAIAARLFRLSIGVFFIGGFVTSSVSLLVPRLKLMLDLDYKGALLVQLSFYSSYLLFALPITAVIVARGYMRSIALGLAIMTAGCLGLALSQQLLAFALVLGALLLLSAGQTFLQMAANTVITVTAPGRNGAHRLTLLQAFNSLGTVLGPLVSAPLLLAGLDRATPGARTAAALPFAGMALATGGLALAYALHRTLLDRRAGATRSATVGAGILPVLRHRRLRGGILAIFFYVGAEVAIGALLPSVLMRPDRLAAPPVLAGQLAALYWGGAMLGRLAGAWAMRRFPETRLLFAAACGAAALTLAAILLPGAAGAAALVAVGLCNAIMYPTIYALALPDDARLAPVASTWLCMAVVGGALVPMLTGAVADAAGLLTALLVPAACYGVVGHFAIDRARGTESPS